MREIKFRAWHIKEKRMIYDCGMRQTDCGIRVLPPFGMHFDGTENEFTEYERGYYLSDVELMEFTGLRDKNAGKIFEGDILKHGNLVFAITVDNQHGYRFLFGLDQITRADANYGEVIGNIYENQGLLA